MWADFQVYIKDASFREEHFCHLNFRSISSHSWVVLILVRKPLEYKLIMIHGPSSLFIGRFVDVSWLSSLYKRCVLSRGTFLSLKLSLYLLSFLSCIDSREKAFGVFFWLWSMVLLAYLLDDSLMWADIQVYIKDASFREEHFCLWNFRSISSHSWVVLILVRKPLEYFWLWSMVLLAYLLDDSLMWADFQVYIKDASFREEQFCKWKFRSISSHSWVVLILVRKPLEYFLIMIHGPSSLFIGRLVDVSWFQVYIKDASFREEHFCHWNFRSVSSHSWVVLILVRKPLEYFLIMIHGPSSLFINESSNK